MELYFFLFVAVMFLNDRYERFPYDETRNEPQNTNKRQQNTFIRLW